MFVVDPINSATQLTPREITGSVNKTITQGRMLPPQSNVRIGWKDSLGGQIDKELVQELNREYILSKSMLRDHEGFKERGLNKYNDHKIESDYLKLNSDFAHVSGRDGSTFLLDGREVLNHLGAPNKRHIHSMLLRSAYESYGSSGEPMFTVCRPKEKDVLSVECEDYIFYSSAGLVAHKILALPSLCMIRRGETPEERYTITDFCHYDPFPCLASSFDRPLERIYEKMNYREDQAKNKSQNRNEIVVHKHSKNDVYTLKRLLKEQLNKSHGIKSSKEETVGPAAGRKSSIIGAGGDAAAKISDVSGFWGGRWSDFPIANRSKVNYYLPNAYYGSTNLAIGVDLLFDDNLLATSWKCTFDIAKEGQH